MIKAVIFDFGGVIKNRYPSSIIAAIFNVSSKEEKEFKEAMTSLFELFQKDLIKEEKFWQKISKVIKRPIPENCSERAREFYKNTYSLSSKMVSFVKDLKNKGIKTAVLSNTTGFQAEVIRKFNGYNGFDLVVLSNEEKLRKPDPEIYILTIKRLELKPEECIFVDDKEENLIPAENLGMKTVLAKNPNQIIEDVSLIISLQNKF